MNDKDIQLLIELAESQLKQSFTRQEALESLVTAGILDDNGELAPPYQELSQDQ